MKIVRSGACEVKIGPLGNRSLFNNQALCKLSRVTLRGESEAFGRAVTIDPNRCRANLFIDEKMLSYDFSRYTFIEPPPGGKEFRPISGKTLRQIVGENGPKTFFACNGQTDGLWAANSVAVAEGRIVKRTAPGLRADRFLPLNGTYSFLAFDPHTPRLQDIVFSAGEPLSALKFRNGIAGPVLVRDARRVDHLIRQTIPNAGPNQLLWDPGTRRAAMSAVGADERGNLIFVSLAGKPELENECLLGDIANLLWELRAVDAILLGVSGDTQQYVRITEDDPWLAARSRKGSSMAQMFHGDRPLANAIIFQDP
jgi:Phosphodiester glycosidase